MVRSEPTLVAQSAYDVVDALQASEASRVNILVLPIHSDLDTALGVSLVALRTEKHGAVDERKVIVDGHSDPAHHAVHLRAAC